MIPEPSNATAASAAPAPGDPQASTSSPRSRTNAWRWVLLALFTFYLLMVNRSYQIADRRPPTFDDAWYLETSLHFYYQLTHNGFSDFCSAYASSFRTKAPLISVLPIPFYLLLGTRYHSAILVNFAFLVIANIYLFCLGRRLFSSGVGLAAVVFYQTMPLVYGLSRVFMADYGLAALVIVWLYYLATSERLSRGSANFALGFVFGLGVLMKVLFPVYVAGPFLAVLLLRAREHDSIPASPAPEPSAGRWFYSPQLDRFWSACARRPFLAIAIPGVLVASTWYAYHLDDIFTYAWQAGYGAIGEQYATDFSRWVHQLISDSISSYYAAALLLLGFAALAIHRFRIVWNERAWILLTWLALPLAAIVAGRNREIRFIIPVLPACAILLAATAFHLVRRPGAQAVLVVLLVIFPLRLFTALSSHTSSPQHHGPDHPVKVAGFILYGLDLDWARPPDSEGDWEQQRVLEALHQMAPRASNPRYVVIGVEHPFLNANLFQYLNAYTHYPLLFTSLGYAETSIDRAVERIYSLDTRYLVMGEGFHNYDLVEFLNRTNKQIQDRLDRGELPFHERAKIPLHNDKKAVIYEREEPWQRFAPGAKFDPPSHPMTVDFAGGVRFLGYNWKPKTHYLSELTYYWTVLHHVEQDYRLNFEFRKEDHVVLVRDGFLADGHHPFYEWEPGEVVRQSTTLYLPSEEPLEADLSLSPWGVGGPLQITDPRELVHASIIPLKLEPQ